jgi:pimeloyl-ACP methyl ester carboxylesterase
VVASLEAAVRNRTRIETVAGFLPSLAALDEYAALDVLVAIPVAVICGTRDPLTPLSHSVAITARTASAELVVVSGAGHMVITDGAEMVADAVDDLLGRIALTAAYPASKCG